MAPSIVSQVFLCENERSDQILTLDVLPGPQNEAQEGENLLVFVVQKAGCVSLGFGDLKSELRKTNLKIDSDASCEILAAKILSLPQAKKSVLKHRPDLSSSMSSTTFIVAAVYKEVEVSADESGHLTFGLWSLNVPLASSSMDSPASQPLIEHKLPFSLKHSQPAPVSYNFGFNCSYLFVMAPQRLLRYDLSGFVPRLADDIGNDTTPFHSATDISSSFIAVSAQTAMKIYNSEYRSIQASLELPGRKRKRGEFQGPLTLAAYFAQARRLIGVGRFDLVGFDLNPRHSKPGSKSLEADLTLANSLGRGVHTHRQQQKPRFTQSDIVLGTMYVDNPWTSSKWDKERKSIEEAKRLGDMDAFETKLLKFLESLPEAEVESLIQSSSGQADAFSRSPIDFTIQKIFGYTFSDKDGDEAGLHVEVTLTRLLRWLMQHNILLRHRIEGSLSVNAASGKPQKLLPGAVARAVIGADPTLSLLREYVPLCARCDTDELLSIIKILLVDAMHQIEINPKKTLPGENENDLLGNTVSNISNEHRQLVVPEEARMTERSSVDSPSLESDSLVRIRSVLAITVSYLGMLGLNTISSLIRSKLSQQELLAMIQFIRQHLFESGYTAFSRNGHHDLISQKRDDVSADEISKANTSLSLTSIVKVLSGCIEVVGPIGFLIQASYDGFIEEMIPQLRSEIALALETLDESIVLQSVLRETLRFIDSVRQGGAESPNTDGISVSTSQKPGTIHTLYSEKAEERGDIGDIYGVLPLSLKAESVSPVKTRRGGGEAMQRSTREMYGLLSRQVGQYSFERLVL